jgi:hypothetical protein
MVVSLGVVLASMAPLGCGEAKQDAGKKDAGKKDAGKQDAGKQDAGKQDAGKPDAGKPDTKTEPVAAADPCVFPTTLAARHEETAWQLFVAATCKSPEGSAHPLAFENWTEQSCLINPAGAGCEAGSTKRALHGSLLKTVGLPSSECSAMTTATKGLDPSLLPFVPTNLAEGAQFCEEVFANAAEVAYIRENSLNTLTGQAAHEPIAFPTFAVEIKVDWLPVTALTNTPPAFDCSTPSPDIYTETIDGVCYAMVGMHISSKLAPKWLWATFEPQFAATNPNRCKTDLYSNCSDSWGSSPATSTGESTAMTPELAALMAAAKLPEAFANYRLVGVQTDYVDANATLLGNSFVEFNAQVPAQQASCITCHSYAQFDSSTTPPTENPNFGAFPGAPPTGIPVTTQPPVPTGTWQAQDFSWMLGIMPAK